MLHLSCIFIYIRQFLFLTDNYGSREPTTNKEYIIVSLISKNQCTISLNFGNIYQLGVKPS